MKVEEDLYDRVVLFASLYRVNGSRADQALYRTVEQPEMLISNNAKQALPPGSKLLTNSA